MTDEQLFGAIYRGDVQSLRKCVATSPGIRDVDSDGRTALMCAVLADLPETTKAEILTLLLAHGAPVNLRDKGQAWTALAFAARDCSPAICSLLIKAGAEVDATDSFGNTPLWRATMQLREDTVRLLLAHGANADLKNKSGKSPRDVAATLGKGYFDGAAS